MRPSKDRRRRILGNPSACRYRRRRRSPPACVAHSAGSKPPLPPPSKLKPTHIPQTDMAITPPGAHGGENATARVAVDAHGASITVSAGDGFVRDDDAVQIMRAGDRPERRWARRWSRRRRPAHAERVAAPSPIAPPPTTRARPSGAIRRARTHRMPSRRRAARQSAAAASGTLSGMAMQYRAGTDTASANPPGRGGIERIFRSGQRLSRPEVTVGAGPAGRERVHRHRGPSRIMAGDLVAEDDRSRASRVVTCIGVHVRAAERRRRRRGRFRLPAPAYPGPRGGVERFGRAPSFRE